MNKLFALLVIIVLVTCLPHIKAKKSANECKGGREFWSCESATKECQRLCENRHFVRRAKSKACNKSCHLSCVCIPGFLREGEDGECIPETECPNA
ncbi:unnamed protein product [Medioppia subpectinata]|uniref:TIL domain-containing protein n=1 Tax=Medioppia subpectinata TaxID=1979941 RepID=A0A7R9Q3A1_9ACAR|nr:unnamed protein product [Medioppia subpectinata]CAG2110239.1 unnamed protein product [Medioppia subpectinata]